MSSARLFLPISTLAVSFFCGGMFPVPYRAPHWPTNINHAFAFFCIRSELLQKSCRPVIAERFEQFDQPRFQAFLLIESCASNFTVKIFREIANIQVHTDERYTLRELRSRGKSEPHTLQRQPHCFQFSGSTQSSSS